MQLEGRSQRHDLFPGYCTVHLRESLNENTWNRVVKAIFEKRNRKSTRDGMETASEQIQTKSHTSTMRL
jgi:hypothetical protein